MKTQVLVLMAALVAGIMAAKRCPAVCNPDSCEALNGARCLAGRTKDDCGCCDVCAKLEGEACSFRDEDKHNCGDGLDCKDNEITGHICLCKLNEVVCGTDNNTYTNLCQLMVTAVRQERTNMLKVGHVGLCQPGAKILTKPEYVRNHTNTSVVLQCEATGSPTPSMAWTFTAADKQTYNMPGDDCKVVTSARGGPGKYMVTSWLQIEGLQKVHEGDYTCVAVNNHHTDRATARIKVAERY